MFVKIFIFSLIIYYGVTSFQAKDFYVKDLPLLPKSESSIQMHAGHLPVNSKNDGSLFFWHFAKKFSSDKSRTVIWLNGGPGQSSLMGAWTEIGPFRFLNKDTIVTNNESWHLYVNLLFIDQPIGTGFSYVNRGELIKELDTMTEHFVGFLDRYVEIFPELLEQDLYLAGESFAGQYIPYIAQAILKKRSLFKLRGLLIGSGWIDPVSLYNSYVPYAILNDLVQNDSVLHRNITRLVTICQDILSKQVHIFVDLCLALLYEIINNGTRRGNNEEDSCTNVYDIRLNAKKPLCGMNGPPELEYVSAYLNRRDVMSSIHLNEKKSQWKDFTESVYNALEALDSKPSIDFLPALLQQIPILFFNGEYDFICNHIATENMLNKMIWNGEIGFNLGNGKVAPIYEWIVDDISAGYIRYARNLTYILFYNAGHMVPYDQAHRSRIMLHQFIQLTLNYSNNQTKDNNHIRIYYAIPIIFIVTFSIIILLSIIRYFVLKQQKCVRIASVHHSYIFQSGQQLETYSALKNIKDDDFV